MLLLWFIPLFITYTLVFTAFQIGRTVAAGCSYIARWASWAASFIHSTANSALKPVRSVAGIAWRHPLWTETLPHYFVETRRPSPWPWKIGYIYASGTLRAASFAFMAGANLADAILLDTGASQHMFRDKSVFTDMQTLSAEERELRGISGIGNTIICPEGQGSVKLTLIVAGRKQTLTLSNCLFVPQIATNLVSGSQLIDSDCDITLSKKNGCSVKDPNGVDILSLHRYGGLFPIITSADHDYAFKAYSTSTDSAKRLWHERMGHLSGPNLEKLSRIAQGMDLSHIPDLPTCTCSACIQGRMRDVPHKERLFDDNTKPGEVIFSDVEGPISIPGHDGSKYFVTFLDAVTKESQVYMMKYRAEVPAYFRQYKAYRERRGHHILRLHSDGGGEYISEYFQLELANDGILFTYSAPYSQQQNGAAERLNQTLLTKAFSSLLACELPRNFWPKAIHWANYVRNRSPVDSLKQGKDDPVKTPQEMAGNILDLTHIRKFGCEVWYRSGSQKQHRNLVDIRGHRGQFLGFDNSTHIMRIRDCATGRIVRASVVVFNEASPASPTTHSKKHKLDDSETGAGSEAEDDNNTPLTLAQWAEDYERTTIPAARQIRRQRAKLRKRFTPAVSASLGPRRSRRLVNGPHLPRRFVDVDLKACFANFAFTSTAPIMPQPLPSHAFLSKRAPDDLYEPTSYAAAQRHPDSAKWSTASKDEHQSLLENSTYTLVEPPRDRSRVLSAKWV